MFEQRRERSAMSDEYPEVTTGSVAARESREAMQREAESSFAAPTGLDALRERFLNRAVMASTYRQKCITKEWWHEAHDAEIRRGIWLAAAEMVNQEQSESKS
jgi:hypothetical protein